MKRRPLPYGFHYNIPTAFDPSVSYDMQYQRLREIVYSIIDNMEIRIPYMIFTTEAHTNDVVTLTGSFYTDHKEVLANKTFSLKGLPDGTYYININAKYKFEPCESDCSCVKAISPDSDMTLETVYMPEGGITLYTVIRKNGEITAVNYNDIYTGMHNIAPDAHENRFSDVYAKIKAEVDRATAAEETLQHNIDNETARAMDAENVLDEKIKAEQNRATAAEHTLQDNIDKEQARAEQAEATLQANITAERNRATAAEDGLQKAIDAERTRAVAAENNLQKNIDNEVTNRNAAVTAERERAVNAENELAGDITAESADRQRADTTLETKLTGLINAEETRATQAEGNLKTAIDEEETARMNADNKEINARTAAYTALDKRIDTEVSNRTAADTALGKRIDTEVSNRTAADTAESDRAMAAEENLQTQVTQLQKAGPGFKQDVFSDVQAIYNGDVIHLNNFKYWDEVTKNYVQKSDAILWLQNLMLSALDLRDPSAIKYTHLEVLTTPTSSEIGVVLKDNSGNELARITNESGLIANFIKAKEQITLNNITITQTGTDKIKLTNTKNEAIEISNIKTTTNVNSAATVKQINGKQDKITTGTNLNANSFNAKTGISINDIVYLGSDANGLVIQGPAAAPEMIVTGIKAGVSDRDAVNKKQLDTKQDKLTSDDAVALDEISVNSVIVRRKDNAAFISSSNGAIKVSDGDLNTPIEIINLKDGTQDNSAATVGQVSAAKTVAEQALSTAQTANQTAAIAQNDVNLIKEQADNDVIQLEVSAVTAGTNVSQINTVTLRKARVMNNMYIISGVVSGIITNTNSIGSLEIDLGGTIKNIVSAITGASSFDSAIATVNNYTLTTDGKISIKFWGTGDVIFNTGITITAIFE